MSLSTYDPSAEATMITALEQPDEKPKRPPEGLLKIEPEKNVDESQMADFATPIEEIMPGPNQMIQDEIMGPPSLPQSGNVKTARKSDSKKGSKAPFGLTDEQFTAAIAGLAAAIAFSKPVQSKLSTSVPKFLSESGEMSVTGMVVSALVAAIVFYFAKQFLAERA